MAKVDYEALAPRIVELVGGEDNVEFVTHCITRLRFNVRDKAKVDTDGINALEGLNGCVWSGNQVQIVIGTSVERAYDAVCAIAHFKQGDVVDENLDKDLTEKPRGIKGFFTTIINTVVEVFVPSIPALMAYGLFAAISSVIGPTGFNLVPVDNGIYQLCNWAQTTIMAFFPVVIAYHAAKKFNVSVNAAIVLIVVCLSSDLMAAISAGEFNLFGVAPIAMTMSGQAIPALIGIWLMSYVARFWKRVLPDSLKYVFQDFLTVAVMLPVMIYVVTPVGILAGQVVSMPIQAIYNLNPAIATALASAAWIPCVSPGLHMALGMAFSMDFYITGVNYILMPATMALGYVTLALNLAIMIKAKDDRSLREMAKDGAIAAFVGGVTEPSIYTIYLKRPRTMLAISLAMGITGFCMSLFHVGAYAASASSFLGLTSFLAGGMDNLLRALSPIAIGMVSAFILVMVLGVDEEKPAAEKAQA